MRKSRLASSLSANSYGFIVALLSQLILVPWFLYFWDTQLYGEWLILSVFPAILTMADFGIGTAGMNQAVMRAARGDWNGTRRVISTMLGFVISLSGFLLIGMALLAWELPWVHWLKLDTHSNEVSATIFWLSLLGISEIFLCILYSAYRAGGKNGRGVIGVTTLRVGLLIFTLIAVACSKNLAILAFGLALIQLVGIGWLLRDSFRLIPAGDPAYRLFDGNTFSNLWRPALSYSLFPVGNAAYFQGLSLVVNALLGATGVVAFNTVRALCRVISQAVTIIKHSAWPEFSRLVGEGDLAQARQLHRGILEGAFLVTGTLSAGLLLIGKPFLFWWTGGTVDLNWPTLLIFLAGVSLNGIWFTSASLLQAANRHGPVAWRYALVSLVAIPVAIPLTRSWGIQGTALAMLLVEVVLLPYVLHFSCQMVGDSPGRCLGAVLRFSHLRQMGRTA